MNWSDCPDVEQIEGKVEQMLCMVHFRIIVAETISRDEDHVRFILLFGAILVAGVDLLSGISLAESVIRKKNAE